MSAGPALRVESPGLLTTIQDLGRPRHRFAGVPPGGALDPFAAAAANLLCGNEPSAGVLECTVRGPVLLADRALVCAVTGGDFDARLNGEQMPLWASVGLRAGDRLDLSRRGVGGRCWLAVGGGFAGERWLGSLSTNLLVGRGGLAGRPLRADDVLELAATEVELAPAGRALAPSLRPSPEAVLGAVRGPHFARLSPGSRRGLYEQMFNVKPASDRMGFRLGTTPALEISGSELLSFGVAVGCLQVPPSGEPILLMADHQTAGGYPVVAGVGRAWLPAAAQLLPGDELRFRDVSLSAAQAEWRRLRQALETLR